MVNIARRVSSLQVSTYEKYAADFKDNIYFNEPGAGVATVSLNYGRTTYNHTAKTSDAQKTSTQKALLNKEFRQALNFAVDRNSYSAQTNGTDGAAVAIRNTFAPIIFKLVRKHLVNWYKIAWLRQILLLGQTYL